MIALKERFAAAAPGMLATLPLFAAMASFFAMGWAETTSGLPMMHAIGDRLFLLFVVVPWVAAWSLLTRLLAGDSRLVAHLRVAGIGLLALAVLLLGMPLLAFMLDINPPAAALHWLTFLVGAVAVYGHLAILRGSGWLGGALTATFALLLLAAGALWYQSAYRNGIHASPVIAKLAPHYLRAVPLESQENTLAELNALEARVAATRAEPVPDELR